MPTVISGSTTLSALTTVSWGIMSLFLNNEPGGWYDPSDLTTIFQDAAGTTAAALESPVGLVLDKSKGLVLGSELVTNGDFSNGTTGWTASAATISVSSGELLLTNAGTQWGVAYQAITTVVGKTYKATCSLRIGTAPTVYFFTTLTVGGSAVPGYVTATASGTYSFLFTASATTTYINVGNLNTTSGTGYFDNISVRELPGSHLSQSTSTARPVLSARVNLLTYSEVFTDAAWTLSAVTPTIPGNITAPDGTSTGNILTETTTTAFHNVYRNTTITTSAAHTCNVYLKAGTRRYVTFGLEFSSNSAFMIIDTVNFSYTTKVTGTGSISDPSIVAVGNGWYRCSFNATNAGTYFQVCGSNSSNPSVINPSYLGDGSTIILWGADLRPANAGVSLPAYQRVTTSTDYDTAGFPLYLKFDGTDDFLVSGTISPGSVDKAQVFAGVRKLSDAADRTLVDYGPAWATQAGSFGLYAPSYRTGGLPAPKYSTALKGPSTFREEEFATYTAPITNVLAVAYDIGAVAASEIVMRINGGVVSPSSAGGDAGGGNFSSLALQVGRYGTSPGTFNGHLYSLILRFSATNMDAATIASTETWVNSKTKAY